jgi:glycosyltransferase involved in cell wall biosynthesis
MSRPTVTVIILTFNEEANLARALDSVRGWADEVFVVDSFSTDRTVDIALARAGEGVRVVQHDFENYSAQWNWALTHLPIRGEWTLKLDADEQVTEAFRREVEEVIAREGGELEGIFFRRRLVFLGSVLKWGRVAQNHDLRMWRTGRAWFEDRSVNEHALVAGKTVRLASYVLHHDFKSLSAWIDKHNRYSSLEAQNLLAGNVTGDVRPRLWGTPAERRMWLRKMYYRFPGRAFIYFLYRFVFCLGFLDGVAGFRYAFLHASYFYWIDLKRRESRSTARQPDVYWPPRGESHPVVARSELQRLVDSRRPRPLPARPAGEAVWEAIGESYSSSSTPAGSSGR